MLLFMTEPINQLMEDAINNEHGEKRSNIQVGYRNRYRI